MKNRIFTIAVTLVALFGVSLTVTAAQSSIVTLLGSEVAEISCDGKRLVIERTSTTQVMATCRPSNDAPTPEPTNDAPADIAVIDLILINADTDQDIGPLTNGATLNLNEVGTQNLSVRAETQPSTVGSVKFSLDDNANLQTENIAPYAIAGDNNGDYNFWTPSVGQHTLTVTPYSETNGGGTQGTALTVAFTVVNDGSEPAPTDTPEPDPTATPQPGEEIAPYIGAPACPEADPTVWHGIWDYNQGCHYTHTHNDNPNDSLAVQLFGAPGAAWGQEISYPWETWKSASDQIRASEDIHGTAMLEDVQYDGSPRENVVKHQGYKYNVNFEFDDTMPQIGGFGYLNPTGYIHGWRMQYHIISGEHGAKTRFHSFYAQLYSCSEAVDAPDPAKCGTIKGGGWSDFGILHVPYKTAHFELPTDPPNQDHLFEPYRSAEESSIVSEIQYGRNLVSTWASDHHRQWGWNNHVSYVFRIHDEPGYFDGDTYVELCHDNDDTYTCGYNGTRHSFETFIAYVDPAYDLDGDGYADFNGYTDRQGHVNSSCNAIGLDCIPYELNHAPVGWNVFQQKEDITPNHTKDYDLCVSGNNVVECPITSGDGVYDAEINQTIGWIKSPN